MAWTRNGLDEVDACWVEREESSIVAEGKRPPSSVGAVS